MTDQTTITIPISSKIAALYNAASPEDQQKMQILFELLLRHITTPRDTASLSEVVHEISERVQERGMTPEILEALLAEDE